MRVSRDFDWLVLVVTVVLCSIGLALIYSVIYFFSVSDTPKGSTYFKPKKNGAMEVSSRGDFFLYLIINNRRLPT